MSDALTKMLSLKEFDNTITAAVRELPDSYKPLMSFLTFIGQPSVVLTVGSAGLLWTWKHNQSAIEHAFIYAAIAFGFNTLLKLILRRARPDGLIINTLGLRSYSFPSGHAFGGVIFYGLFAYLGLRYLNSPVDIFIATMLGILVFLIGVSRVYLGAHYPSDVLGGWILGIASLVIVCSVAF